MWMTSYLEERLHDVRRLKETIIRFLGDAKFVLHKWHSNIPEVEKGELQEGSDMEQTYAKEQMGVAGYDSALLGVPWDKKRNKISVTFSKETASTKRGMLQNLAAIYDHLGLVSPVLLRVKILYRDM